MSLNFLIHGKVDGLIFISKQRTLLMQKYKYNRKELRILGVDRHRDKKNSFSYHVIILQTILK